MTFRRRARTALVTRPTSRARAAAAALAASALSAALAAAVLPFGAVAHGAQPAGAAGGACRAARGAVPLTGTKGIWASRRGVLSVRVTLPGLSPSQDQPI